MNISEAIGEKLKMGVYDSKIQSLLNRYSRSRRPIEVSFRNLVPEFNGADRATHLMHTYPAKLLMHIPFFFLNNNIFSKPGNVVLDPFCGSGTVLLETIIAGRKAIGADSNPLARLISEVKTSYYDIELLKVYLKDLKTTIKTSKRNPTPEVVNIDYWFLPHIKSQLADILVSINDIENEKYKKFFLVCFSNCIKKVSLADPRVSVPVKLKAKQYHRKHPLRKETEEKLSSLTNLNVKAKFFEIVVANILKAEKLNSILNSEIIKPVIYQDARHLKFKSFDNRRVLEVKNNSVDLIISSPPYAGAQKYIRASSLSLGWLQLCGKDELKKLNSFNIGREDYVKAEYQKLAVTGVKNADILLKQIFGENPQRAYIAANYLNEMRDAITESARVLKPGGYFILIAANNQVCGKEFKTQEYLRQIAEDLGLTTVLRLIDDIKSYGLMTKRNKTANIITREWVLVFKK
jgi:DNA modification methylase